MLARWHPGLLPRFAEFIKDRDETDTLPSGDLRALLAHGADRSFGFALWISTVARFTVLRVIAKAGLLWLGPDAVERWSFSDAMERLGHDEAGKRVKDAADHAFMALLLIDQILSEELFLDHRMARPDTRSLQPCSRCWPTWARTCSRP